MTYLYQVGKMIIVYPERRVEESFPVRAPSSHGVGFLYLCIRTCESEYLDFCSELEIGERVPFCVLSNDVCCKVATFQSQSVHKKIEANEEVLNLVKVREKTWLRTSDFGD